MTTCFLAANLVADMLNVKASMKAQTQPGRNHAADRGLHPAVQGSLQVSSEAPAELNG